MFTLLMNIMYQLNYI